MSDHHPPVYEGLNCPVPLRHTEEIILGHGSGGKLTDDLIKNVFMPHLASPPLSEANDFAVVQPDPNKTAEGSLIVSTDGHIVSPIVFPGGDIGRLAVCGTVNDISMSGGTPLYLTASFILEEGLPVVQLRDVVKSMKEAAEEANVQVIAGDTKVVERGKADKIFIATTGIGWLPKSRQINGKMAQPGDVVIVSGTLGDHGIAVLAAREELGFLTDLRSDVAPLNHLIAGLLRSAPNTHVLRDPTRGGLATSLNEIANQSQVSIWIKEQDIPVNPAVNAACEMLGFDPMYIANEGKVIAIVPADEAREALSAIQENPYGRHAAIIGEVRQSHAGQVLMQTAIGGTRILERLAGEILPRIC
ncbi:MAG: hydrogenase expression/formation protein HypE [Anaerolineae bacterium]|nr:hydrogenase expression/formation protein HypE [Anaerolineae bacterium]